MGYGRTGRADEQVVGADRTALARERALWRAVARPPCGANGILWKLSTGVPLRDVPSCSDLLPFSALLQVFLEWRDPDSKRGHHDFQPGSLYL
jgi:hypothetical protein